MLASRATLPQKQRQQRRWKYEGGMGGRREEERERRKKAKEWATRENGRWREEDEKCNYDFEKWARPFSRKKERMSTLGRPV